MSRLLGLDIGGTRSRARICVDGQVVAEAEAASASLTAAGRDRATAALADLLGQLPLDPGRPFDAACAGTAGSSVPGAREFLHDRLAPLTRSGIVVIVNDAMLVLPAAGLDAGVGVICGTGSIAVGKWRERQTRAGGFGYLLGDEGSGYWIARAAVRALLDRRDRARPWANSATACWPPRGWTPSTRCSDCSTTSRIPGGGPGTHRWSWTVRTRPRR